MVDLVFFTAACLVGSVAQELVEPHPYAAPQQAGERVYRCGCACKDNLGSFEPSRGNGGPQGTYDGEEDGLVVRPGE